MSVICSFLDDRVYSAQDVSNIFKRLTTSGVNLFNYNEGDNVLENLNEAVSELVTPGVELYDKNACKLIYESENKRFLISPGTAFMCDGASITIDSESYDITDIVKEIRRDSTDDIWISFFRNTVKNSIDILVETDSENYNSANAVKIARIVGDSTVYDKREYSKTKVAPCSANVMVEKIVSIGRIYESETGVLRKRAVITDVFPGATKVYVKGALLNIQRVDTEDGNDLTFASPYYGSAQGDETVAFNMTGEGLEVWVQVGYGNELVGNMSFIIM